MDLKYPIEAYDALGITIDNSQFCMNETFEYKHCKIINSAPCPEIVENYRHCLQANLNARMNMYTKQAMIRDLARAKREGVSDTAVHETKIGFIKKLFV